MLRFCIFLFKTENKKRKEKTEKCKAKAKRALVWYLGRHSWADFWSEVRRSCPRK